MDWKIAILLGLVLVLAPSFALADGIIPGEKSVSSCYQISNINDYPEYVILLYGQPVTGYQIINSGDCFSFYKNSHPSIYAVRKSVFSEAEIGNDYQSQNNYFQGNPKVIPSGISLYDYGTVTDSDPLEKVATALQIVSLDASGLNVQKSKITYTYTDGTSEEKLFQTQDVIPGPSRKAAIPSWLESSLYIIIPLAAIIAIALILLLRKRK